MFQSAFHGIPPSLHRALACVVLVLMLVPQGWAQSGQASLSGRVLDGTGGAIPGATVTAARTNVPQHRTTAVTDREGRYDFRDLTPGTYDVTAGYVEHATHAKWKNRVQVTYSGSRDEFPGSTAFGEGKVEDVTLVDFVTAVRLSRATLTVGIENLVNASYFPPINQAFNDGFNYIAGRGRTISVTVSVPWSRQ